MATVMMGITTEELQVKIRAVYEKAKEQEGVDLKAEADAIKSAIRANPAICSHLLDEDIGMLVLMIKGFHNSARAEAINKTAAGKKAKKAETKSAIANVLKKPMSKEDLANEFDDL